jgi:hypothetical protein
LSTGKRDFTSLEVARPLIASFGEYRNGEDPETIRSRYPTLTLEQVNGAIVFHQRHKEEVELAMEERRRAEDAYTSANPNPPVIKQKFERSGGKPDG